jgi:hypothetical protein
MSDPYYYDMWRIRPNIVAELERYARMHVPLGDFLRAVVENDLMNAIAHADADNKANLPAFAAYMYNEMPAASKGSPEAYQAWISKGVIDDRAWPFRDTL